VRFAEVIEPSPKIPALKFIREVALRARARLPDPRGASRRASESRDLHGGTRLSGGKRLPGQILLLALGLGLSSPVATQELRTTTEYVAASSAASPLDGRTFESGSEDGSLKLWNVTDTISAAGASASLPSAAPPAPGRLVALVIANGAYPDAPLQNPLIDSGLIADSLKRIGFTVTVKTNVNLEGFEQAISDFAEASKGAEVALFYFAGHGFSVAADGVQQNMLMTTSSNFQAKTEIGLRQGGEPLDHVEDTIIGHARATLIFIDACRNVPILAHRGIASRGFAPIDPSSAEGAYVVLSTRQGKTAEDGEAGQGSPFARAVAATLPTAGLRIEDAAARIRKKVREETSDAQDPDVVRSDLPEGGVVLLAGGGSPSPPAVSLEASPPASPPSPAVASLDANPPVGAPSAVPQAPAPVPAAGPPAAAIPVGPPPKIAANDPGGEVFKECDECPDMVVVPAGKAMLGSPVGESGRQTFEAAPHMVEIAKPFAVGRYAVTFAEWDACFAEGACGHRRLGDLDFGRGKHPAIFASWSEAQLYVQWLKRKTGQPYRLLSEAEWEYAARGCRSLKCGYAPFWFGAIKPELAVYDSRRSYDGSPKADPRLKTAPVDSGPPNPFGLYNMLGNVRQWTEDCWNPAPSAVASNGAPVLSGDCSARATRGGSWADDPAKLRAAARDYESVDEGSERIGFRIARDLGP
jgi:formylglycine-generating enzyme required for sulfatase activity